MTPEIYGDFAAEYGLKFDEEKDPNSYSSKPLVLKEWSDYDGIRQGYYAPSIGCSVGRQIDLGMDKILFYVLDSEGREHGPAIELHAGFK